MSFTPKSYSKTGEKNFVLIINHIIIKSFYLCNIVFVFLLKTVTTSSTRSTKVDDGKKKSLLKDNSWIRANVNEEEQVE